MTFQKSVNKDDFYCVSNRLITQYYLKLLTFLFPVVVYDFTDCIFPPRCTFQQSGSAERVDLVSNSGTQLIEQEVTSFNDWRAHFLVRSV